MWLDVVDMRDFYSTRLGHVVRRRVRHKIRELFPNAKGKSMMALGYPTPFVRAYREEAQRLIALMPAEQGALSWSGKVPNIVTLTEETQLPLPDKSIDLALVIHALEFTSTPQEMLREVWRVLSDGGKMIVVVPNRTSIWARLDKTPFGHGHPYSLSQLNQLLRENTFSPLQAEHALYVPPTQSRLILGMSRAWENIGHRWFRNLSGVLIVEASKQIYAGGVVEEAGWKKQLQAAKKLVTPMKN